MAYTELTVWTRGIVMDLKRAATSSIPSPLLLASGGSRSGDGETCNPDRTNCPTRKYCRVSDHRARE